MHVAVPAGPPKRRHGLTRIDLELEGLIGDLRRGLDPLVLALHCAAVLVGRHPFEQGTEGQFQDSVLSEGGRAETPLCKL
jgi:hypothetical protein